jgi:hypothetical protein
MRLIIVLALSALIPLRLAGAAAAETATATLFACSIGKKTVTVTVVGQSLVYRYGTPAKAEMSIVGTAAAGNIFQMTQRYAGTEYQLRFTKGEFSYIVYSSGSNANVGAAATSGLVVMRGMTRILDKSCSRFAQLTLPADIFALPEDTAAYSAM